MRALFVEFQNVVHLCLFDEVLRVLDGDFYGDMVEIRDNQGLGVFESFWFLFIES
jgi:hypothetical protein